MRKMSAVEVVARAPRAGGEGDEGGGIGKMVVHTSAAPPVAPSKGQGKRHKVKYLPAEVEEGNQEYKLQIASADERRIVQLASQMKWRVTEGGGQAIYHLGVEDNGTPVGVEKAVMRKSLANLKRIAASLRCRVEDVQMSRGLAPKTSVARVVVSQIPSSNAPEETRVLFLGEQESGKSTLIGVLERDEADDGSGLARLRVLLHQHELDSGNTSSVSCRSLRFGKNGLADIESFNTAGGSAGDCGGFVPPGIFTDTPMRSESENDETSRIVNLIDSGGNPRFLKSALYGLTAMAPDFALVVVDACIMRQACACAQNDFFEKELPVTLNQIKMLSLLQLPFAVVLSKSDVDSQTRDWLGKKDNLEACIDRVLSAARVRIAKGCGPAAALACSSVTLQGVDELRGFLGQLSPLEGLGDEQDDAEENAREQHSAMRMYIREAFFILGFDGAILGGVPLGSSVTIRDRLRLGPDQAGDFHTVVVKSIRSAQGSNVDCAEPGRTVTLGVSLVCDNNKGADSGEESSDGGDSEDQSSEDGLFDQFCAAGLKPKSSRQDQRPDKSSELDFFRSVVRRGTCLLNLKHEVKLEKYVTNQLVLERVVWMSFATDGDERFLGTEFNPDERMVYVLRCNTIKRRVNLTSKPKNQTLKARFLTNDPEILFPEAPVLLQHGSLVGIGFVKLETY